ncbi:MAG: hypothetical protein ABSB49_14875 [Polyangia bacterium]
MRDGPGVRRRVWLRADRTVRVDGAGGTHRLFDIGAVRGHYLGGSRPAVQ